MFEGSSGSISTVCTGGAPSSVFSPETREELEKAVDVCLDYLEIGDATSCPQGPMSEWAVSRITNMSNLFKEELLFNGDISEWDVSRVKKMRYLFQGAQHFQCNISKWDVSRVNDMSYMFDCAELFDANLSKWNVSLMNSMFWNAQMFEQTLCGASWVASPLSGCYHVLLSIS